MKKKRQKKIDQQAFADEWQTNGIDGCMKRWKLTNTAANHRAENLRKNGVDLKRMPRGRPRLQWDTFRVSNKEQS